MVSTKSAVDLSDSTKVSFYYTGGGGGGSSTPTPIFTVTEPGLVPAPGSVQGLFLSDDGQWLEPSVTGAQSFMLSSINSGISNYRTLTRLEDYVPAALCVSAPVNVLTTPTILAGFITPPGLPGIDKINIGTAFLNFVTTKASGTGAYFTWFTMSKYSSLGVETLLLTSQTTSQSILNTPIQQFAFVSNPDFITLDPTDRIVVKVFAQMTTGSFNITISMDGNTNARFQTPYANNNIYELVTNKQNNLSPDGTGEKYPTVDAINAAMVLRDPVNLFSLTNYNLPATSALQKSFNSFVDSVDLGIGIYKFSWLFGARNLSPLQATLAVGFLGTAAITPNNVKFSCNALKTNDPENPGLFTQSFQNGLLSATFTITEQNIRSNAVFSIDGIIRIFVPGTLIPSVASDGFAAGTAIVGDRQIFQITKLNI